MSASLMHLAMLDVQRGYLADFDQRFRGSFLPEVLTEPGWERVRVYECLDGEPSRLSLFDLSDTPNGTGLRAAPMRDAQLGRRVRNYHARTYRQIFAMGPDPALSQLINLITVDIVAEHAMPFSRWYDEVHVPEIIACPGWNGARRYESVDGDPRFLAVYGLQDSIAPFATQEYEAAVGWDEFSDRIRGYHGFRIYRLIYERTA